MSTDNVLPPVDPEYNELVKKELVVLKDAFNDKNCNRVYRVIEKDGNKLTVEVILEFPINGKTPSTSMLGRQFKNVEMDYFTPFF